jgi:multidrug efflux pump
VGEVAWPIIASTATTLAAFVPLMVWPGMMGEFMKYLPITLIIVLGSSLFVALVINPVLTAAFMKVGDIEVNKKKVVRNVMILLGIGLVMVIMSYQMEAVAPRVIGNLLIIGGLLGLLNTFVLSPATKKFQGGFLPKLRMPTKAF